MTAIAMTPVVNPEAIPVLNPALMSSSITPSGIASVIANVAGAMPLSDIEQVRFNMVEQQIRTWEVLDQSVLDLLFIVKRENFVPPAYRTMAFMDTEIPLGNLAPDQYMLSPKMEARIVQEVIPLAHERVLLIGAGTGYLAALIASLTLHVIAIEIFPEQASAAAANINAAGIHNIEVIVGDAAVSPAHLIPHGSTFDIIVFTGSVPILPPAFLPYLAAGARLFAVIGDAPAMQATIVLNLTHPQDKGIANTSSTVLFETVITPLINAAHPSRFTF